MPRFTGGASTMPELPEVETTRRGVEPALVGRSVRDVRIHDRRLRQPVTPGLTNILCGKRLLGIQRRAKYLLFDFGDGTLLVHLGMSGSLRIVAAREARLPHDHVELEFSRQHCLRFRDPRRFGLVLWVQSPGEHSLLAHLGPEPLGEAFDGDHLYRLSRGRKAAVKNFVMDGRIVVGVGNIYASEALFRAGILPTRAAGRVSRVRYATLAEEIKAVLSEAITAGGTTLRDFMRNDGEPGYFRQDLRVYGRADEPCVACGRPIVCRVIGQRSSFFCRSCQR